MTVDGEKMIVLVRVHNQENSVNPPLGLLYVGDALKKAGHEVKVYHISEKDIYLYADEICKLNPLWVGFSVNTGWSMKASHEMSKTIKRIKPIPIVWGNAHPSLVPEQCLCEEAIDYVVIGEGEITAVELSDALSKKTDISSVKGIGFKNDEGQVIINERRELIQDLDQYEMDWSLIDMEKYVYSAPEFGMKRAFQFITSRGCPHNCSFCFNLRFNRRKWRAHSEEYVVSRILKLRKDLCLDGIRFWDDNFFTDKKRAFSILEKIDLPYTSEIRVDYINEEFVQRLSETRCRMVLLGFESGSDRILKLINKGTTSSQNMQALRMMNKHKDILIHPSFLVGLPTETAAEYQQTIDQFADMIQTQPNFWFVRLGSYVPYPGTDLYDMAVSNGFKAPSSIDGWENMIFDTSHNKTAECVDWMVEKKDIEKDERYLVTLDKMNRSRFPFWFLKDLINKRIRERYYKFEMEMIMFRLINFILSRLKIIIR